MDVNKITAMASRLSIPQLQQAMRDGSLPPYVGMPILQQKVKESQAMKSAQASGQPKPPSVAEQIEGGAQQASMDDMMRQRAAMMHGQMAQTGGISDMLRQPEPETKNMAAGGRVKHYAQGDLVSGESMSDQLKRLLAEQEAAQYGEFGTTGWTPEEIEAYKRAGWTPEEIAKYKSPGVSRVNNPSVSKYPTINVPEGGFNAQTNYPATYRPGEIAPVTRGGVPSAIGIPSGAPVTQGGLPAVIPSQVSAGASVADPWAAGAGTQSWGVPQSIRSAAGKVGSTVGKIGNAIGTPLTIADMQEMYAVDPKLIPSIALGDKEAIGKVRLPGVIEGAFAHGWESGPAFDAYRFLKNKFSDTGAPTAPTKPATAPSISRVQTQQQLNQVARDAMLANNPQSNITKDTATRLDTAPRQQQQPNVMAPPIAPGGISDLMREARYNSDETDIAKNIAARRALIGEDPSQKAMLDKLAEREARLGKEEERAPWMALLSAGLGTMAGTSPFAMANIGQGAQQGMQNYMHAMDKIEDKKDRVFDTQAKLAAAKRSEDIAIANSGISSAESKAAHNKTVSAQEAQLEQNYALKKSEIDMQDRYHQGYIKALNSRYGASDDKLNTTQIVAALKDIKADMEDMDPNSVEYKSLAAMQGEYRKKLAEMSGVTAPKTPATGGALTPTVFNGMDMLYYNMPKS